MRALTLRQPWAWAVCHAGKDVENRSWPIPAKLLTGTRPLWVMLHAGKQWDDSLTGDRVRYDLEAGSELIRVYRLPNDAAGGVGRPRQPLGAVVAVVEFTGCHRAVWTGSSTWGDGTAEVYYGCAAANQPCGSDWAEAPAATRDVWHWEIGEVRVLPVPILARGRQGLWVPDDALVAAVSEQLEGQR